MPNTALSAAVKEAFAHAATDVVVLDTLEINHPAVASLVNNLDICFCVDDTGSMGGIIEMVQDLVEQIIDELGNYFVNIRFALTRFKDEDNTSILTGATFTSQGAFTTALDTLTASGGGDDPENGYGAIKMSCDTLDWRSAANVGRVIILLTDTGSHERGATKAQAISALTAKDVIFCYGVNSDSGYDDIVAAVGGEFVANTTDFVTDLVDAIRGGTQGTPNGSLFIVRDRVGHTLTLEDGHERDFIPCPFNFTLPGGGANGLQELMLAVDNVDRAVSDFLAKVLGYNIPVTVVYRPYLASDPSGPQLDPPLRLFLRNVSVDDFKASGRASMADIINRRFPSDLYTRKRFPSLGN